MFGDEARALQGRHGSRSHYEMMEARAGSGADLFTEREIQFIGARDSFYLASVTQSGWPYVQHRGGPRGFLRVLDPGRFGFADYTGNRQYQTAGNLAADPRVALILVDYAHRKRLKVIGTASRIERTDDPRLVSRLMTADYTAHPEAAIVIDLVAFDWNCSQHITPRWTADELSGLGRDTG
ncbi:MAG: pyridoxamine 5'-phosphate oxidase family protein [Rhodospirillum sp.]|nr:pyridoxamine 5'-phosphate oxidase family protein [Rhodospirillum sp.]MCF8487648.1 pyridoxamine 5'-phosphate oxidase family protein [Rhodospirillum sp.]MCF8502739.1 pyridoxamine 5'-phosphate oxidase family protein [Rhodospirillum sp.]